MSLSIKIAERLMESLKRRGSIEYAMTWKERVTPAGRQFFQLAVSAPRTSGNGCGGWPTPNAMPTNRGGLQTNQQKALERRQQGHMLNLDDAACLAGWATPTTRDHKDGASDLTNTPINGLLGRQVSLSPARTEKRGALNPAFSLWLMGFPPEWESCAPAAMR